MKKIAVTLEYTENMDDLLRAGADEVIFALKHFSMTGLNSFDLNELPDGEQVSYLLNRMFFPSEIDSVRCVLRELSHRSFSSLYFADPCVAELAEEEGLKDRLIYRPETLTTGSKDVVWWGKTGLRAVSISPLLTESEVLKIATAPAEKELTIHGHLVMSVSRRPLLTAYEKTYGLSESLSNRKDLILKEEKRDGAMPVYEGTFGTIVYSDFVQCSFGSLNRFADAGYNRFMIDGVYRPAEELSDTVKAYRAILDGADAAWTEAEYCRRWANVPLSTGYYGQKTIK